MSASQKPATAKAEKAETDVSPAGDLEQLVEKPPGHIVVAGVDCVVNRVKTRELTLLARVVTRGMGKSLEEIDLDELGTEQIAALLVMSIPESGEAITDLIAALIEPEEKVTDDGVRKVFQKELSNPDIDVTLEVLQIVIEQEREVFPMLLGKFRVLFKVAAALFRKTGL